MDQAEQLRSLRRHAALRQEPGRRARVIAVTSGKGGVGKSSLTVNLGIVLTEAGRRVGILDADLGLANVDILLGLSPAHNLTHVLFGQRTLSEIATYGHGGLVLYPGGSGVTELADLSQWRLERFLRAIAELDDQLDTLLIDTGAGIARGVVSFLHAADELVVVTTPEPTAIADAYAVVKSVALRKETATIHLVVNMARSSGEAHSVWRSMNAILRQFLSRPVQLELLGHIPSDPSVGRSVLEQVPFVLSHPKASASLAVRDIAVRLCQEEVPPQGIGNLFRRMAVRLRR